jgi:hypothetical protein
MKAKPAPNGPMPEPVVMPLDRQLVLKVQIGGREGRRLVELAGCVQMAKGAVLVSTLKGLKIQRAELRGLIAALQEANAWIEREAETANG